ncbi:tail fiber protein [Parasutterella excrementihominis]|uniref:phage tail protein n=1 Tax=Parasutterella excrementihominis TaxID=487175 RepID=UPI003AB5D7E7
MAELSLPHASITKIPNMAPATPTLWNSAYKEIDENFAAIKTKVNSLDQATQAASESSSGIVQLSTSDEVIAGTEETKVVTPAGLKTLVATETRKGLVDLATENDFDTYAEATNPVEVKKVGTVASIVKWVKKAIAKAVAAAILAAIPPGTVIYYLGDDIPNGFLLTNGASVLKTDFPLLYAAIGDKFGNVDDQHFNLPNTHHRFLEGTTNIEEVGTYVSAGLPNILGSLSYTQASDAGSVATGSLGWRGPSKLQASSHYIDTLNNPVDMQLDASKSSSLYVNDLSEVRVNALFGMNLIRAF